MGRSFNVYCVLTTLCAFGVAAYAFSSRQQFYPTIIYLVTSKMSIMVLGNMALMLTLVFGRVVKRVFLRSLREAELEIIWDHSRFAVTETALALTIFREELTAKVETLQSAAKPRAEMEKLSHLLQAKCNECAQIEDQLKELEEQAGLDEA